MIVELDRSVRLEPREQERLDEFFQRHAVLQSQRDRDGEAVHQAPEGRAFLVHVQEDLSNRPVRILARPQVNLVAADDRLLGVAEPPLGHPPPLGQVAHQHSFGDLLGRLHDLAAARLPGFPGFTGIRRGAQGLAEL